MNTIPFTVKTIRPGTTELGITEPKIIFDCFAWGEWDITFCAHGIKLRWHCDDCAEYFGENEAADELKEAEGKP